MSIEFWIATLLFSVHYYYTECFQLNIIAVLKLLLNDLLFIVIYVAINITVLALNVKPVEQKY